MAPGISDAPDVCSASQTACALERFRLAQGQYPDSLEALAPNIFSRFPPMFLPRRPTPLKYLRAPDGGFKLYSVGFNRVDDGGKPNLSLTRADILWQLSKDNFDLVWVQPGQHLIRNHAEGRESFNAKARSRKAAKRMLNLKIRATKR